MAGGRPQALVLSGLHRVSRLGHRAPDGGQQGFRDPWWPEPLTTRSAGHVRPDQHRGGLFRCDADRERTHVAVEGVRSIGLESSGSKDPDQCLLYVGTDRPVVFDDGCLILAVLHFLDGSPGKGGVGLPVHEDTSGRVITGVDLYECTSLIIPVIPEGRPSAPVWGTLGAWNARGHPSCVRKRPGGRRSLMGLERGGEGHTGTANAPLPVSQNPLSWGRN